MLVVVVFCRVCCVYCVFFLVCFFISVLMWLFVIICVGSWVVD